MVIFDAGAMKRRLEMAVENQRRLRQRVARSPGDTELETTPDAIVIEPESLEAFGIDVEDDT